MTLKMIEETRDKAMNSCTTFDTMRAFVVQICDELIGNKKYLKDIIVLDTGKTDMDGKKLFAGDVIENEDGFQFLIKYGVYQMYCPADRLMMDNVGFYTICKSLDCDMPLGPTEEYAHKVGSIFEDIEIFD